MDENHANIDNIKAVSSEYLKQMNFNYIKLENESLKLDIDYEILAQIKKLDVKYYIEWYLNGNKIAKSSKMSLNDDHFIINDLKHDDSGIYYCVVELEKLADELNYINLVKYHSYKYITIGVYTVVVVSKHTQQISSLQISDKFNCNEKYLEFLIKNQKYELTR